MSEYFYLKRGRFNKAKCIMTAPRKDYKVCIFSNGDVVREQYCFATLEALIEHLKIGLKET